MEKITIAVDGSEIKVGMQTMLNHQLDRLLTQDQIDKFSSIKSKDPDVRLVLYFKYGADGTSGQAEHQYKGNGFFSILKNNFYLNDHFSLEKVKLKSMQNQKNFFLHLN